MWTEKELRKKLQAGLIRAYTITSLSKRAERSKFLQTQGKQKYWIQLNLVDWCNAKGVELVTEFQFLPNRKFRFDWAIPSLKIAIEYEGIFSEKSRHTTFSGYSRDAEKYNAAVAGGWRVLRYTAGTYKQLLTDLNNL